MQLPYLRGLFDESLARSEHDFAVIQVRVPPHAVCARRRVRGVASRALAARR